MTDRIICESFLNMHGVKFGEVASWPDTDDTWQLISGGALRYLDDDRSDDPVETAVDGRTVDDANIDPVLDGWAHGTPGILDI